MTLYFTMRRPTGAARYTLLRGVEIRIDLGLPLGSCVVSTCRGQYGTLLDYRHLYVHPDHSMITHTSPANTRRWPSAGLMFNIKPTLGERPVFWDGSLPLSIGTFHLDILSLVYNCFIGCIYPKKYETLKHCCFMLGQRRRRCSSIEITVVQRLVFARIWLTHAPL